MQAGTKLGMAGLSAQLLELQTNLTKQQQIDDALSVKAFLEGDQFAGFARAPTAESESQPPSPPAPPAVAEPSLPVFPPRIPQSPPTLPTQKCRIVALFVGTEGEETSDPSFDGIATNDFADIVALGSVFPANHVVAIRENGDPVRWSETGELSTVEGAEAVDAMNYDFTPEIVYLRGDGKVDFLGGDGGHAAKLRELDSVVKIHCTYGIMAALRSDGTVAVLGKEAQRESPKVLAETRNVCEFKLSSCTVQAW